MIAFISPIHLLSAVLRLSISSTLSLTQYLLNASLVNYTLRFLPEHVTLHTYLINTPLLRVSLFPLLRFSPPSPGSVLFHLLYSTLVLFFEPIAGKYHIVYTTRQCLVLLEYQITAYFLFDTETHHPSSNHNYKWLVTLHHHQVETRFN